MADRIQLNPKSNAKLSRRGLIIGGLQTAFIAGLAVRMRKLQVEDATHSSLAAAKHSDAVSDEVKAKEKEQTNILALLKETEEKYKGIKDFEWNTTKSRQDIKEEKIKRAEDQKRK